ncbi:MAG: T9SS type A sorting domain-containing protein [Bacteroidia bacterium]|nr:T9SS type A sorting domain-containing protein [Bacteroidia bacterium]
MKTIGLFFLLGVMLQLTGFCQADTIIKHGYANIATLMVDYDTYAFMGGNISYYSCPDCMNDSLPFSAYFNPPLDFGDITFELASTSDTIFNATIIWMGTGQIYHPTSFTQNSPFSLSDDTIAKPSDTRYIGENGVITNDSVFKQKADSAWNAIDTLNITKYFSDYIFKAGIYLYPPTVGMFNPQVAKWIVFLYYYDKSNLVNYHYPEQINVYPDPASDKVFLDYNMNKSNTLQFKLCNLTGAVLSEGLIDNSSKQIDISTYPDGMYFLVISDNNGNVITTRKVIKN